MKSQRASSDGRIRDLYDGQAYRDLTKPGGFLDPPGKNFTMTLNTDGVAVFKTSRSGELWPVYLVVNELPPQLRYTKKYMVLCGFWLAPAKPKMSTFLKPLMTTLERIYRRGIEVKVSPNCTDVVRGLLMMATADLPAKAKLLVMKQYNGAHGCNECQDPGRTLNGPLHRVWPYTETMTLRTHRSIVENVVAKQQSTSTDAVMGFNGAPVFLLLPRFDLSKSFPTDWMHAVLSGVVLKLMELWFKSKNSTQAFYIGGCITDLNEQLLAFKVPNSISHRPRRIGDRHHWKASEIRAWLLHYSLPLLRGVLPDPYFEHYYLLVTAIATLASDEITEAELTGAEERLDAFCRSFESLYGQGAQTMNVHKLRHLAMYVRRYGPLWVYSLFGFETMNGHLKRMIHGTKFVANQIIFTKAMSWELGRLALAMGNEPKGVKTLAHRLTSVNGRANRIKLASGLYRLGGMWEARERPLHGDHLQALRSAAGHDFVHDVDEMALNVFYRAEVRGQTIHSIHYGREKAGNSRTVEFTQGGSVHFGEVQIFCCVNEAYFAVLKDLVPVADPLIDFESVHNPIVKEALRSAGRQQVIEITETNTCRAVPISSLRRKCVLMNVESAGNDPSKLYIGRFPNVVEPD
ncbi:uncharacterized protein LOC144859054 [Branchiostoma floridae x Branchiostoma japonicum]